MNLTSIFSSPTQRKRFIFASLAVVLVFVIVAFLIANYLPPNPNWNTLNNLLISVVASGIFAIFAALYLDYFFVDPSKDHSETTLLPQDIGKNLEQIASSATHYRIYVRTGRHFRAALLPLIQKRAIQDRRPIELEVILLDCRDEKVCQDYADYRSGSSFDHQKWTKKYVQTEILSTVMALSRVAEESSSLVRIKLYLSKRLSAFRIEGSNDEILVTREDPKDKAKRYTSKHLDFGAYLTDFNWIRKEASQIMLNSEAGKVATLRDMFGDNELILMKESSAKKAMSSPSPYAR